MWQDLKHGTRMLMKNPGFTFVAVISIAIGVGANAAMFSVADGLVFRPLPVPRAERGRHVVGQARDVGFGNRRVSYPDYVDLRDRSKSFRNLVAYNIVITSFTNRADEPAQRKVGMAVSGNSFDAMEVRPALGRTFGSSEDQVPGRDAVVVLDHDEWTQQFSADPAIVGQADSHRRSRVHGDWRHAARVHRHRSRRPARLLHSALRCTRRFRTARCRTC